MNVIELRELLTGRLEMLKSGEVDAKTANAMVNVAARVMGSVKLEMDYARMHGKLAHIEFMQGSKQTDKPSKTPIAAPINDMVPKADE
jgi:hypothetical protein